MSSRRILTFAPVVVFLVLVGFFVYRLALIEHGK